MNSAPESSRQTSLHSRSAALQVVGSRTEIGAPDTKLTGDPVWVNMDLNPFKIYNIVFSVSVNSGESSNALVFLFDVEDDNDQPRNAWGTLSPQFGRLRYRYLPPADSDGLTAFKVTVPASGRIRIGLRTFRNRDAVHCSARVAVEPSAEQVLIAMSAAETTFLQGSLLNLGPTDLYLEFGAGGSTALAAKLSAATYSVESDPEWIAKLQTNTAIQQAECAGRLHFHHADIGPTALFGHPSEASTASLWPRYYLEIWGELPKAPQLVLIDGRFRLACALSSFIAAPDALVAIHDVGKPGRQRSNYVRILEVADEIARIESLLIVKRRSDASQAKMLSLLAIGAGDAG